MLKALRLLSEYKSILCRSFVFSLPISPCRGWSFLLRKIPLLWLTSACLSTFLLYESTTIIQLVIIGRCNDPIAFFKANIDKMDDIECPFCTKMLYIHCWRFIYIFIKKNRSKGNTTQPIPNKLKSSIYSYILYKASVIYFFKYSPFLFVNVESFRVIICKILPLE